MLFLETVQDNMDRNSILQKLLLIKEVNQMKTNPT